MNQMGQADNADYNVLDVELPPFIQYRALYLL